MTLADFLSMTLRSLVIVLVRLQRRLSKFLVYTVLCTRSRHYTFPYLGTLVTAICTMLRKAINYLSRRRFIFHITCFDSCLKTYSNLSLRESSRTSCSVSVWETTCVWQRTN